MSQNWTDNSYQMDHDGRIDLQTIEDNFKCLKTVFKGDTAPTDPIDGQQWYDSSDKLQKFYDETGVTWITIIPGDEDQQIWDYQNSVCEGMVLVSIVDKVLALKGGQYGSVGGVTSGGWVMSHSHGPGSLTVDNYHRHAFDRSGTPGFGPLIIGGGIYTDYRGATDTPVLGNSASSLSNDWRPAAAVGILIKPDL